MFLPNDYKDILDIYNKEKRKYTGICETYIKISQSKKSILNINYSSSKFYYLSEVY